MGSRPLFQLNSRLAAIAGMVPPDTIIADVGTDHAYLPIWLVKKKVCPKAVAMDIRRGPLDRARENMCRYQVEDKISLRLSDGLEQLSPGEADIIVIAGMGGELISRILSRAQWLKQTSSRLILQPMSAAAELRMWLSEEKYRLQREIAVMDAGRIYTVMEAFYSWVYHHQPPRYPYVGKLDYSELAADYVRRELRHLQNQASGARALAQDDRLHNLTTAIQELRQWLTQGGIL